MVFYFIPSFICFLRIIIFTNFFVVVDVGGHTIFIHNPRLVSMNTKKQQQQQQCYGVVYSAENQKIFSILFPERILTIPPIKPKPSSSSSSLSWWTRALGFFYLIYAAYLANLWFKYEEICHMSKVWANTITRQPINIPEWMITNRNNGPKFMFRKSFSLFLEKPEELSDACQ